MKTLALSTVAALAATTATAMTQADLAATKLTTTTTTLTPGDRVTFQLAWENRGNRTAGSHRVGIFESADSSITTADVLWGSTSL